MLIIYQPLKHMRVQSEGNIDCRVMFKKLKKQVPINLKSKELAVPTVQLVTKSRHLFLFRYPQGIGFQ